MMPNPEWFNELEMQLGWVEDTLTLHECAGADGCPVCRPIKAQIAAVRVQVTASKELAGVPV